MPDLAYDVTGSGLPLVLIHGLGSSRQAWDLVVPDLAADFRVWTVDLPGHGDSRPLPGLSEATPRDFALALADFLDQQGIVRPHLVGNSLGGWTALEAAADGVAASVVALCPAGLWIPLTRAHPMIEFNRRAAQATAPLVPAIMRVPVLRRILMRAGAERPVPYRVAVDAGLAQATAQGFPAAQAGAMHRRFDRADQIPSDVPVTVLFGDHDRILPAPDNQIRGLAPNHTSWEVAWNCGHAPMWDVPGLTTHLIRRTAAGASR